MYPGSREEPEPRCPVASFSPWLRGWLPERHSLAYLFSGFHYLQHIIFSLHYHTTAFLYFILLYPAKLLLPSDYGGVVLLALFIYLPVALVRVYGSGWPGAIAKGLVLGISYYMLVLLAGAIFVLINLALL